MPCKGGMGKGGREGEMGRKSERVVKTRMKNQVVGGKGEREGGRDGWMEGEMEGGKDEEREG